MKDRKSEKNEKREKKDTYYFSPNGILKSLVSVVWFKFQDTTNMLIESLYVCQGD